MYQKYRARSLCLLQMVQIMKKLPKKYKAVYNLFYLYITTIFRVSSSPFWLMRVASCGGLATLKKNQLQIDFREHEQQQQQHSTQFYFYAIHLGRHQLWMMQRKSSFSCLYGSLKQAAVGRGLPVDCQYVLMHTLSLL